MSDTVSFGEGILMPAQPATMRIIFAHIREYGGDNAELASFVDREEEFDAIGGYFFDTLSVAALQRIQQVLERLDTKLPGAISNFAVEARPQFYKNLAEFKEKLFGRIAQLQRRETGTRDVKRGRS